MNSQTQSNNHKVAKEFFDSLDDAPERHLESMEFYESPLKWLTKLIDEVTKAIRKNQRKFRLENSYIDPLRGIQRRDIDIDELTIDLHQKMFKCNHDKRVMVKIHCDDGRYRYTRCCVICGHHEGWIPSGHINPNDVERVDPSSFLKKNWTYKVCRSIAFLCVVVTHVHKWSRYNNYIDSRRWKEFRLKAFEHYGGICMVEGCTNKATHVHHLTYERIGHEIFEDVEIVCTGHHKEEHPNWS